MKWMGLSTALRRAAARGARARVALALCLGVLCFGALCLSGPCRSARAQPTDPPPRRAATGAAPIISVITFGPGDHIFSKFGHDAFWVHDPSKPPSQRDRIYNYGTFRFDSPWLIFDFLKGNLNYWLSVSTLQRTVAAYRAADRSIVSQRLQLEPEAAREMVEFLDRNARPENKYYRYDYYRNNCSTKLRDLIDRSVGGALSSGGKRQPARLTYREHTRRLTQESPALFFALDLALGPLIDHPVTRWDEAFLPSQLEGLLADVSASGSPPLVAETRTLFMAKRPVEPTGAPPLSPRWLAFGLAIGAALAALGWAHERRLSRWSYAGLLSIVGLVIGLFGASLLVLWLLTDHDVTYWNQNVLLCPVWALALPVATLDFARREPRRPELLVWLTAGTAGLGWFLLLLQPLLPQSSGPAFSLFLPLWTGAALGALRRAVAFGFRAPGSRSRETSSEPTATEG